MPDKAESYEERSDENLKKTPLSARKLFHLTPVRIVIAASILTIVLLMGLGWQDWQSYVDHKGTQEQVFPIQGLRGQIIHFDEVLTMSANMSAATGDQKWETRYRKYEPQLDTAIKELRKLAPETFDTAAAKQTDEANIKLVAMENQVFQLVGRGRLDDAQAILSSDEYCRQKKLYGNGMERIAADLENYITADLASHRKSALIAVVSVLLSLLLLTLIWLWVLRNMRRYLKERYLAEQALRESEKKYRGFMEASPDATTMVNENGQILMVNSKMEKLFGYTRQELLGKVVEELMPQRFRDIHVEHRARFSADPAPRLMGHGRGAFGLRKDGTEFPADISLGPLQTEEGLIVAVSLRDITEKQLAEKALQESEIRFRDFFANVPIGFHIFGSDQMITEINDAELDMIGYHRDEIVGKKTWADLILPEQSAQFKKHWNDIITKGNVRDLEYTLVHKQGHNVNVLLNGSSRFDANGNLISTRGSVLNITERKQAEQALEIEKEHAEAANIAKSQFLANMSHEIRTPISVITGFSDMLINEGLTKDQFAYTELIRNAGKSLLVVINDILDFSKIEAGKLEIAPADYSLNKMLDDIDSMMRPLAEKKGLQFEVICSERLPAIIQTDHDRLHQCLVNLVGNAIKFTPQGHVHLKISVEDKDAKRFIRFDVEDTGIGIPPDKQEHIFDSFSQVEKGSTRKYGGTGLGLTITSQLSHLLGGELTFTSAEGKGSIFSLLIPAGVEIAPRPSLEKAEVARETVPTKEVVHMYSGKVLVAEDDEGCRVLTTRLLERLGLEVATANDGKEAVEKSLTESFDMIFMDVRMPILNGFEATEALHEKKITVPIIALTAHAMEGDRDLCIQAGCDDYLAKPIEREKMLEILDRFLPVKI